MDVLKPLLDSVILTIFFAFLVGAAIGSFLNVVIHRLPLMMYKDWSQQCKELQEDPFLEKVPNSNISLAQPASRCPECSTAIHPLQNIPILSYLILRGKCSHCHTSISPRYFAIELACSLLAMYLVYLYGPTVQAFFYILFTFMLVPLVFIDIEHKLLPDSITYLILWIGVVYSLLGYGISLDTSVIGVLAGYLSLWSVYISFKVLTGKEGMGHGDFKLFAAIGAWVGWKLLLPVILIASISGTLLSIIMMSLPKNSSRKLSSTTTIPFGPYLAIGGWITLIWGHELVNWYLKSL